MIFVFEGTIYVWVYIVNNKMRYHTSIRRFKCTLKEPGYFGALQNLGVVSETEVREVPFHPWTLPVGWQMQGCKDTGRGANFWHCEPERAQLVLFLLWSKSSRRVWE